MRLLTSPGGKSPVVAICYCPHQTLTVCFLPNFCTPVAIAGCLFVSRLLRQDPERNWLLKKRPGTSSDPQTLYCRDWNAEKKEWGWARAPPVSQKSGGEPDTPKKLRKKVVLPFRDFIHILCIKNEP